MRRVTLLGAAICLGLLLLLPGLASAKPRPADSVYVNGYVYTVDKKAPLAQAVAVRGAKIVFVGSDRDARMLVGKNTKVVDLKGRMMMPGLIDSHQHPLGGASSLLGYNLFGIQRTIPDLQAVLQGWLDGSKDQEPDGWFQVMGYRGALPRGYHLVKADLDALTTQRPIIVQNWDGHSIWVNTRALTICGIDKNTPDVPDGIIERDAQGNPTGYFADAAIDLIRSHVPGGGGIIDPAKEPLALAQSAERALNEVGITGIMDAYAYDSSLSAWTTLLKQGKLTLRVANALGGNDEADWADPDAQIAKMNALRDKYQVPNRIIVSTLKFINDGVPDFPAQNAWMLEPYLVDDGSGNWIPGTWRGESWWTPSALKAAYKAANLAGWQTHMHALGDASVRLTLDAIQEAQEAGASKNLRDTIVHLEPVARSDVWRFGQLNVVANCQPQWFEWDSSTWDAANDYLGPDRMENIYPLRSFEIAKAPIAFGSDWPVDPLMPWYGIERAVTRTAEAWYGYNEMGPLNPWESTTLKNALKYYTMGSAYQIHMENKVGSITKGKYADMIVLDQNIFKVPITKVDQTKVLTTIANGKVVYTK
jgi:predicted amidohydrolase YtcJ